MPSKNPTYKPGVQTNPTESFHTETLWQDDSFRFIHPDEYESLGIDPSDIPLGTFATQKQPSQFFCTLSFISGEQRAILIITRHILFPKTYRM